MNARLALRHCQMELLHQLREPGYLIQALVFPSMFFLFFGVSSAGDNHAANLVLGSYATYAFLGVIFNQFTGSISASRQQHWDEYLRTLPASYSHRLAGWTLAGMVVGIVSLSFVTLTALMTIEVSFGPEHWLFLGFALLFGSIAVMTIAMAFGYWLPPGVAMPIASLVYLSLTYAGGIWTSPNELPGWVQVISPFLPTRQWAELAWASVQSRPWPLSYVLGLLAYLGIGGIMTTWGYRRQQRGRSRALR